MFPFETFALNLAYFPDVVPRPTTFNVGGDVYPEPLIPIPTLNIFPLLMFKFNSAPFPLSNCNSGEIL